eukprot:TRINITY_DN93393_c0_g1_i1.p1 TRINITY_DN93393_c0_g1~~TRINITY_DN93393_c0_g1_i1.p1  ORF type:complete len:409 (-),score=51.17 TRINITY_DN93393_c0_g1_i1:42-1268(-)
MMTDEFQEMSSLGDDLSRIAEEHSKIAAKVKRMCHLVKASGNGSNADEFVRRIGALRAAAERRDWARLALEIGDACGLQVREELPQLLQSASKAAANPRLMLKALEQQRTERRRQIHSDLTSLQPVLPLGGPKLNPDSTTAVLGNCGYPELAHLACVSRGSLSAVYSPSVQCGRIIDLARVKVKKTDDLLRILTCGGRWGRASGLVLPRSNLRPRLDAWGKIAAVVPGLVHLDIDGLPFQFQTRELFTTIVQHFPSLRTFKGAISHIDLSEDDGVHILGQLSSLTELEELDLETKLYPATIQALYTMLTALTRLKTLDLRTFDSFPIAVLRNLLQYDNIQDLGVEVFKFDDGEYTVQSLIQALRPSKVRNLRTRNIGLAINDWHRIDWHRIKAAAPHVNICVHSLVHV